MNSEGKQSTPRVACGSAWALRAHSAIGRFFFSCAGCGSVAATVWPIAENATAEREGHDIH